MLSCDKYYKNGSQKMSIRKLIFSTIIIIIGLNSPYLWVKIISLFCAAIIAGFILLDDIDFYKKLDRIASGEKNIKL